MGVLAMNEKEAIFCTGFMTEPGTKSTSMGCYGSVKQDGLACWIIAERVDAYEAKDSAKIAVERICNNFAQNPTISKLKIKEFLFDAHQKLKDESKTEMLKASLVMVVTDYTKMIWAVVGNVRLYHFRSGEFNFRSKDQTIAQVMLDSGLLVEDEVNQREERNNLINYMGGITEFKPYISEPFRLQDGDVLLLCNSGVWEKMKSSEITALLAQTSDPNDFLTKLKTAVLTQGNPGAKNYTLGVVFAQQVGVRESGFDYWNMLPKSLKMLLLWVTGAKEDTNAPPNTDSGQSGIKREVVNSVDSTGHDDSKVLNVMENKKSSFNIHRLMPERHTVRCIWSQIREYLDSLFCACSAGISGRMRKNQSAYPSGKKNQPGFTSEKENQSDITSGKENKSGFTSRVKNEGLQLHSQSVTEGRKVINLQATGVEPVTKTARNAATGSQSVLLNAHFRSEEAANMNVGSSREQVILHSHGPLDNPQRINIRPKGADVLEKGCSQPGLHSAQASRQVARFITLLTWLRFPVPQSWTRWFAVKLVKIAAQRPLLFDKLGVKKISAYSLIVVLLIVFGWLFTQRVTAMKAQEALEVQRKIKISRQWTVADHERSGDRMASDGQYQAASREYRAALRVLRQLHDPERKAGIVKKQEITKLIITGDRYLADSNYQAALQVYSQANPKAAGINCLQNGLTTKVAWTQQMITLLSLENAGDQAVKRRNYIVAKGEYQSALRIAKQIASNDHITTLTAKIKKVDQKIVESTQGKVATLNAIFTARKPQRASRKEKQVKPERKGKSKQMTHSNKKSGVRR
jgi:serine/threonine protein phosphatase PrpC/tetratricopeptide (TPR) repeat protein